MVRVLELFSGTGSVGKVCEEFNYEVVSLDLENATINTNILDWDYKKDFNEGDFDIIWASPPCHKFSKLRSCWIGKTLKQFGDTIVTKEMLENDMIENGLPIVYKTLEIIEYFKPKTFFIENPKTGRMKEFLTQLNYYDVDYCQYSTWGYKKSTRIWTNLEGFTPKICNENCINKIGNRHKIDVSREISDIKLRYRIPYKLIRELFRSI